MKIAGMVLIIAGLVALIFGGIRYTTHKREIDMGPIQVDRTEHHDIPISPIAGLACMVAGGVMIFAAGRTGR
jgi:hypothetical protein